MGVWYSYSVFLCCFFFLLFLCVVFVFCFIKISKFALPGVMLLYERTSKDRKKERYSLYVKKLAHYSSH